MGAMTASSPAAPVSDAAATSKATTWDRLILALLVVVAVVVRFVNIGSQSYWGDEDATVGLLRESFWDMLRHGIVSSESTPPLYYVVAAVWTRLFGTSEFALRSLSALAGVAAIGVAYAIGVELRSRRAGLV